MFFFISIKIRNYCIFPAGMFLVMIWASSCFNVVKRGLKSFNSGRGSVHSKKERIFIVRSSWVWALISVWRYKFLNDSMNEQKVFTTDSCHRLWLATETRKEVGVWWANNSSKNRRRWYRLIGGKYKVQKTLPYLLSSWVPFGSDGLRLRPCFVPILFDGTPRPLSCKLRLSLYDFEHPPNDFTFHFFISCIFLHFEPLLSRTKWRSWSFSS